MAEDRLEYLSVGQSVIECNSVEQSSALEANSSSASQEIPHILWNPKV
jgi:hypothetical protein